MTEKELKKMNRYQLLELLILQTERSDALQRKLDALQEQMDQRELELASLGSIAEASLKLGGVFEAAQEAADLYLAAARKHAIQMEKAASQKAERIVAEAQAKARQLSEP